jgi:hypothetical protein
MKTYFVKRAHYWMSVLVNKKERIVEFERKGRMGELLCTFSTDDKDLQKAIESDSKFGSKILLDSNFSEPEGMNVPLSDLVTSAAKAKAYLTTKKIASEEELDALSVSEIIARAKESGINFPNWPAFAKM